MAEWDWKSEELLRWVPIIELGVAGLLLGLPSTLPTAFLPYLLTAAAASAVRVGLSRGFTALGMAAIAIIASHGIRSGMDRESALQLTEWLLLSALGVLAGSWARSWERQRNRSPNRYQAANILLTQLRDVTRELPTGLDEVTAGDTVLSLIRKEVPFETATLLRTELNGPPQPLAIAGADAPGWYPDRESWLFRRVDETQQPAQAMVWVDPDGWRRE